MQKPLLVLFALALSLHAQDVSGTYTGTVKMETPEGSRESPAAIIIKQHGDALTITAGPRTHEQRPASKVERKGEALTFEVIHDGDARIQFDLAFKGTALSGKFTMMRGDQSRAGQLELVKQ